MIAEWASIYIIYDASLMETESEFAPWDLSKAHILVSTPVWGPYSSAFFLLHNY